MLRSLLTLLALLTGLAATSAQAEVRHSGIEDVRFEAGAEPVAACHGLAVSEEIAAPMLRRRSPDGINYCPRPKVTVVIPTIMLGPDRARE